MPIVSTTYEGIPEGSNLAVPLHEIADTQARYVQDALLDQVGLVRRRGVVKAATSITTLDYPICGLFQATDPAGTPRVAALNGTSGASAFSVLSDDYTTKTNLTWNGTLPQAPYYVVDGKPALGGGTLVGSSKQYGNASPVQTLALWRGGNKANYTTGTVTITRGSASVTGSGTSWAANAVPGMFLFAVADDPAATTVFIGVVKTVGSNTAITLEAVSPYASTAATYTLKSLRGITSKYVVGRITTETAATLVTGAGTKFKSNSLDSGDWRFYRASDGAYIGKVSSVTSDTAITLSANAALALDNERFVALKAGADYGIDNTTAGKFGFLNAVYAGFQFYANAPHSPMTGEYLWYSDPTDLEAIDVDPVAGNFIPVTTGQQGSLTSPVVAIAPTYNALLVLKENECFGLYGSTPTQFQLRKLTDEGAFSGMSVQQYEGGVIFAGRNGIFAFDGTSVTNITLNRLGDFYKSLVRTFDPQTHRMWSMLDRDHYTLFIESVTSPYSLRKGTTSTTPSRMTISVYLPTQAVTFLTNLDIRGAARLPASAGKGVWYAANTVSTGYICSSTDLFESEGVDTLTCYGNTAGPDFYLESKRYAVGDALRKKVFKSLMLHYYCGGDDLRLDTMTGLNEPGTTSTNVFRKTLLSWSQIAAVNASWSALSGTYATWEALGLAQYAVKRITFLKRSQHFGFRIWQDSADVTQARLGPWALGFKVMRAGRV